MNGLVSIPIGSIDIGPNVRIDAGDLTELSRSIAALGVLQPIKVTPNGSGRFRLVWGQRRLLAAREAGLPEIPALVVPPDASVTAGARRSIEQLSENLQRKSLNPMELATGLRAILDGDRTLTQTALADVLGRSGPWLSNTLRLLNLAPRVQQLVREGVLPAATARVIGALPADRQATVARWAVKNGWSDHEAERRVHAILHPAPKRVRRGRPRLYEEATEAEHSRSVVIPIRSLGNGPTARVSIGIEGGLVDLTVEDGLGHGVSLSLRPADAKLLGRRLTQAWQAVAS